MIPKRIPRSFTHQKSSRSRKKRLCTIAKMNIGQKSSFMCSQVDSFTPENGAIHTACPSQSYKKCNNVPPSDVIAKPISCQSPIDRFIRSPSKQFLQQVYSKTARTIPQSAFLRARSLRQSIVKTKRMFRKLSYDACSAV